MIQIKRLEDIKAASLSDDVKAYLSQFVERILSEYRCESLDKVGGVYFLNQSSDIFCLGEMGLQQSLKEIPFEYCEAICIKSSHEKPIQIFHGCLVCDNGFAVDFFVPEHLLDEETKRCLEENMF